MVMIRFNDVLQIHARVLGAELGISARQSTTKAKPKG